MALSPGYLKREEEKEKSEEIKYIPFGKKILVELPDPTIKTESGIVVADKKGQAKKKEKENEATVVKFGTGFPKTVVGNEKGTETITDTGDLKVGDKILFNEISGELVKQGKRRFKIIELEDIYAIIK